MLEALVTQIVGEDISHELSVFEGQFHIEFIPDKAAELRRCRKASEKIVALLDERK